MKKSATLRPVSQKAYARFVERINLVVVDMSKREAMLKALDKYLEGDTAGYACGLAADCIMAFEMLRHDIDLAMARSAKARMRARKNKQPEMAETPCGKAEYAASAELCTVDAQIKSPDDDIRDCDEENTFVRPLTRRQRRQRERWERPKMRWGKL